MSLVLILYLIAGLIFLSSTGWPEYGPRSVPLGLFFLTLALAIQSGVVH